MIKAIRDFVSSYDALESGAPLRRLVKTLMWMIVGLALFGIAAAAASDGTNPGQLGYRITAFCRADATANVRSMVEALRTDSTADFDKLFKDKSSKCWDVRMFNRAPVMMKFVREVERIRNNTGYCWAIIELEMPVVEKTLVISWTSCALAPKTTEA